MSGRGSAARSRRQETDGGQRWLRHSSPCRESSRWVINGFTAVEFAWRWDVDVGSPLGEFLVGHKPSRVWRFGLALIKSSPLLGWGEFEVAHLHHCADVYCCLP